MNRIQLPDSPSLIERFWIVIRGFGMGAADIVPGFSGGTVALITGIYERLVQSISRFDRKFLRMIWQRQWRSAADHVDLGFLLALIVGIAIGLVISLLTIHKLLNQIETRPFVLSAFIGMILGSSYFLWRSVQRIRRIEMGQLVWIAIGIVVAGALSSLPPSLLVDPPYWYLFLCGAIAICAMILPGISGALMLTVLGVYEYLIGVGHQILHRENLGSGLLTCLVFGWGCLTGLLSFSRLLKWLFAKHEANTLCILFGLMLGSMVKLWPYQPYEGQVPDASSIGVAFVGLLSAVAVIAMTRLSESRADSEREHA